MRALAVGCAVLVVLAGCSLPVVGPVAPDGDDRLGYESGYATDDALSVTPADGFNASEREAILARTMARVEAIRGLEFERTVEVELMGREEYRSGGESTPAPVERRFADARWEALFAVGEDEDAAAAFEAVYDSSVVGFYSDDRIVVVSDGDTPRIDTRTLVHELVHALQDQHRRLGFGPRRTTFDGARASQGLTEGDASYVESLYDRRCALPADDPGSWDCLEAPAGPSGSGAFDTTIYATLVQPYVDGPEFVRSIREAGGWAAVNDAYDRVPESTEQTIHPDRYPDEPVVEVGVADRSTDGWSRLDRDPATDRLGEVSVFTMLRTNGVIDSGDRYDYSHPASSGWAGDRLVPYRNAGSDETGYVWRLAWDSAADAREFLDAYRDLLASENATLSGDGDVYVVPAGPFADAFRVTRDGATVTVVNAPTRGQLDAVHPAQ